MKNYAAIFFTIGILLLLNPAMANGASSPKAIELSRKISEMSSLQRNVGNQVDIAVQTREQLQKQIDELVYEINQEMVSRQIKTYPAAKKNSRIKYNLRLIQQLHAYIERLKQREKYFRIGNQTLEHLQQQVSDDLQLIRTLNDMEIDKLIYEINVALDEYIPETQKPVFAIDDIQRKAPEIIWNEIFKRN
jgi:hypothetical protein